MPHIAILAVAAITLLTPPPSAAEQGGYEKMGQGCCYDQQAQQEVSSYVVTKPPPGTVDDCLDLCSDIKHCDGIEYLSRSGGGVTINQCTLVGPIDQANEEGLEGYFTEDQGKQITGSVTNDKCQEAMTCYRNNYDLVQTEGQDGFCTGEKSMQYSTHKQQTDLEQCKTYCENYEGCLGISYDKQVKACVLMGVSIESTDYETTAGNENQQITGITREGGNNDQFSCYRLNNIITEKTTANSKTTDNNTTTSKQPDSDSDSSLSDGALAGIIIGSLVGTAITAYIIKRLCSSTPKDSTIQETDAGADLL